MKVMSLNGVKFASKEMLPATCISKPQVTCTAISSQKARPQGYSNEEIYNALVAVKDFLIAPFKLERKPNHPINYLA